MKTSRLRGRKFLNLACVACLIEAVFGGPAGAFCQQLQAVGEKVAAAQVASASAPDPIPPPPAEFAELMEAGQVKFKFYLPSAEPRQWPGQTNFHINYHYRADNRWKFRRDGEQILFVVNPSWRQVAVKIAHEVELPQKYQGESFWNFPLVRHEMDHVRISTNGYWQTRFLNRIAETKELVRPVSQELSRSEGNALAKELIDEAVKEIFSETVQLIRIRYNELDERTSHGVRPLPVEFWERVVPES